MKPLIINLGQQCELCQLFQANQDNSLSFKELTKVRWGLISRQNDVCDSSEAETIHCELLPR